MANEWKLGQNIRETNLTYDLLVYAKCLYDIGNVYDENQGEGGLQY